MGASGFKRVQSSDSGFRDYTDAGWKRRSADCREAEACGHPVANSSTSDSSTSNGSNNSHSSTSYLSVQHLVEASEDAMGSCSCS